MKKVLYISSLSLSLLASVSFAQDDVIFEADLSTGQPALSAVILAQKVEFPQEGVLRADCLGLSAIECSAAGLSTAADTTANAGTMATASSTGTIAIMNSGTLFAGTAGAVTETTGAAATGSFTVYNEAATTASAGGYTAIIGNLNLNAGTSYTQTETALVTSVLCCLPGSNPAIMDASTLPEYLSNEYLNSPVSLKAGQCLKNLSRVGAFKVICEKTETDVSENVTDSASSVEELSVPVSSVSDEEAAAAAEASEGEELPVASDAREEL